MELTAASVAGLTITTTCAKAHQRDMVITEVRLLEKDGGKSGHFVRAERPRRRLDASAAAAPAASELPHICVVAACISGKRARKHPSTPSSLWWAKGIAGDAHAGTWHRQ